MKSKLFKLSALAAAILIASPAWATDKPNDDDDNGKPSSWWQVSKKHEPELLPTVTFDDHFSRFKKLARCASETSGAYVTTRPSTSCGKIDFYRKNDLFRQQELNESIAEQKIKLAAAAATTTGATKPPTTKLSAGADATTAKTDDKKIEPVVTGVAKKTPAEVEEEKKAKAAEIAAVVLPPDAPSVVQLYFEAGATLSDLACDEWFAGLSRADQKVGWYKDIFQIVGNTIIGIAGFNGAAASSLGKGALGLAAGGAGFDAFRTNFIYGTVGLVHKAVSQKREATLVAIFDGIEASKNDSKNLSYDAATRLLLSYHNICSPEGISEVTSELGADVRYTTKLDALIEKRKVDTASTPPPPPTPTPTPPPTTAPGAPTPSPTPAPTPAADSAAVKALKMSAAAKIRAGNLPKVLIDRTRE